MNKLEGLIFKTQNYKESSKLLHTYTKKGKVTLLAKGANRYKNPNRILAQYLTEISFEYNKFKGFMPLYSATITNEFSDLKSDYNKAKHASLILEILDKTALADEKHETIYQMAIKALNSKNIEITALSFSVKMLYLLGFGMNLKGDGRQIKGINIAAGGVVYATQPETVDLSIDDTIELLKLTYLKFEDIDLETFNKSFISNIKNFVHLYYNYHMNLNLKALQ